MSYLPEDQEKLSLESLKILGALQALMEECVKQGQEAPNESAREYMLHGAGRRVMALLRSVKNIFSLFPPSQEHPLKHEDFSDVQINLHAFLINLYGVWGNWAWAFVYRHGFKSEMGSHHNIGLFNKKTQKFLPAVLSNYLKSDLLISWQRKYLTNYRDALAHRIPPYVPPAYFTEEEGERYNKLQRQGFDCIGANDLEALDRVEREQAGIGRPCFGFLHSFSPEEKSRSLALHAQLISDSMLVVEFGKMFCAEWHQRAYPHEPVAYGWRFRVRSILRALSQRLKIWETRLQ